MHSAGTGNTSGKDLSSLGNELTELACILVIDCGYLVGAELANLLSLACCEIILTVRLLCGGSSSGSLNFFLVIHC